MLKSETLQSIFNFSSTAYIVLLPDSPHFTIVDVNEAFLNTTNSKKNEITGKSFFEVFAETSDASGTESRKIAMSAFEYVLRFKKAHKIGLQRYDIPDPTTYKYKERYWNIDTFPLFDPYGNVEYLVMSPADITDIVLSQQQFNLPDAGFSVTHNHFSVYPDSVFTLSLSGHFISANDFAGQMAELSKDELLKLSFASFIAKEELKSFLYYFQKACKGEISNFETRIITAKGNSRNLRINSLPLHVSSKVVGVYIIAKDITDRIQIERQLMDAEIALLHSEKRFKALVQEGFDMIGIIDTKGNFKYLSPSAERVSGYKHGDLIVQNLFSLIHAKDRRRVLKEVKRADKEYRVQISAYRFLSPDKQYRWMETTVTNMVDDPSILGLVINSRDVSRRIDYEQRLKENVERYNIVSKATSDAIWDWDLNSDKILWNKGLKGIFGHNCSAAEHHAWKSRHVHPEDRDAFIKSIQQHIDHKIHRWTAEYRFRCADGKYKHVLDRGFLLLAENNTPLRMIGAMQDITDKKQKENELQESLKKYELILNATQDAIYEWDLQSNSVTWNHSIGSVFGYPDSEGSITSEWLLDKIHPKDIKQSVMTFGKAIENNARTFNRAYRFRCSDESYKYISESSTIIYNHNKPVKVIGAIKDVDDLTRVNIENNRLAHLIEKVDSVIVVTDVEGVITWVNPSFSLLTGYTMEESIGKRPGDLLQGPDTDPEVKQQMHDSLIENQSFTAEVLNYSKSGKKYWVRIACTPVLDQDKDLSGFIAVQHEITERKEKEARIERQTQLLKTVAWMSSHEIRRPVANILAVMKMIRSSNEPVEKNEYLEILHQSTDELDNVIKKISHKINSYGL